MNRIKISYQFFASTQSDAVTTSSQGMSAEMKTFYDKTLIELAMPALVHDQFAQKRPIPEGNGTTIEFRKFSSLDTDIKALVLSENVIPDGAALSAQSITATVSDYGNYVKLSDKLELASVDRVVVEATKKIAEQAAAIDDKITREKMLEGTQVIYAGSGTARDALTTSNVITVSDIFKAAAKLKANNAPTIGGSYVAIIHPYVSYDLMQAVSTTGSWLDVKKYTDGTKIFNGELGKLGGVRFVETSQAKVIRGANLAGTARSLKINNGSGYSSSAGPFTFDGGTVEADALIGRYVIIGGTLCYVTDNTSTSITVKDAVDHTSAVSVTAADNADIYPGEGGAGGISVFCTLIVGADAYATTDISGGGIEHIVHDKGQIGGPLNQFSTVGFKLRKTAEILTDEYMVRIESCSATFTNTAAN